MSESKNKKRQEVNFQPFRKQVLVEINETEKDPKSGIIVAAESQKRQGLKVIKVGKDCEETKEGDIVYLGTSRELPAVDTKDGNRYYLCDEWDLNGKYT